MIELHDPLQNGKDNSAQDPHEIDIYELGHLLDYLFPASPGGCIELQ